MKRNESVPKRDPGHADRLWPRIRPWASASLAGGMSLILICAAEIAYPRAILDFHGYLLRHVWPERIPFRAGYVRAGLPFLVYMITSLRMSAGEDAGTETARDCAAHYILSKSFSGIFLIPPAILFTAIQVKAGWHGWSDLFSNREFDLPFFLGRMRLLGLFSLQSVAVGLVAYVIKRERAALLAVCVGGMGSLVLVLAKNLLWISGVDLPLDFIGGIAP